MGVRIARKGVSASKEGVPVSREGAPGIYQDRISLLLPSSLLSKSDKVL